MIVSFPVVAGAVFSLLLLIVIGFYAAKIGIIDEAMSKKLSQMVVRVAQPFMLFRALINVTYSKELLLSGLQTVGIALLSHAILALFAFLSAHYIRHNNTERILTEYAITFVNAGFMGFPLVEALFGDMGLFRGAFYVFAFNLSIWSYGMILLARGQDKSSDGERISVRPLKMIFNHGTVPCVAGFLCYALQIKLPMPIAQGVTYMNHICTPLVLLVIGANLSRLPLKKIFLDLQLYVFSFLRLLAAPCLIALIYHIGGMEDSLVIFFCVMASLPSASLSVMFAEIYDMRPDYAAKTVGVSTVLSMFTIPVAVLLCSLILKI